MTSEPSPPMAHAPKPPGNVFREASLVTPDDRARVLGQRPVTVWFTGLSGSGKSTLAQATERTLIERGAAAYVLDGDNIRHGLNADLGFSPEDRTENIRRIGEVCRLLHDAGLIVLTAFISPYKADRDRVRSLHPKGGFIEVFIDTPLEVCEQRDVKGLYAAARTGELRDFSGVSAPYEPPADPELTLDTSRFDVETCVGRVLDVLGSVGVLGPSGRPARRPAS